MCDTSWSIIIICLALSIGAILFVLNKRVALNERMDRLKEESKTLDRLIYLNKEVRKTKEILSAVIERTLENESVIESQAKQMQEMQKKLDTHGAKQ